MTDRSGQSLLETIFALGILLFVVAAVLGLATSNIASQDQTQRRFIATNLARESIEVVRSLRDSNWLAGEQWDTNIVESSVAVPVFELNGSEWTGNWHLDFSSSNIDDDQAVVYLSNGIYNHSAIGEQTEYRRIITLRNICSDGGPTDEIVSLDESCQFRNGVEVTATVAWRERERERIIELRELLYGWK